MTDVERIERDELRRRAICAAVSGAAVSMADHGDGLYPVISARIAAAAASIADAVEEAVYGPASRD